MNGKNRYLLGEQESPNRQPDIHETIRDLEHEIARGGLVYTTTEIATLERKLDEYREILRVLTQA
jgi:hypothetical protein